MADLRFDVTVPQLPGGVDSAALGASAAAKFGPKDLNKAVKLAGADNYILAADGNDLEGVVITVEAPTVNDGFSFGSVMVRFKHQTATVSGTDLAVGAAVVCGPQAALGTAQADPVVKAGAGVLFKWRVKSLLGGTGAAGTTVLIEPITR